MQLKLYTEQQTIYPEVPESYAPTAVSEHTLKLVINDVTSTAPGLPSVSRIKVMIACPILITFFTVILIVIALLLYAFTRKDTLEKGGRFRLIVVLSVQAKASIISIGFISFSRVLLFLFLDIGALINRKKLEDQSYPAKGIYNMKEENDNVYSVPWILVAFDGFAILFNVLIVSAIGVKTCCSLSASKYVYLTELWKKMCFGKFINFNYYCLSLTVIPLIISGLSHAPYIIMAYVSDADYASSIFVYYTVILFIEFGLVQYTFRTYFERPEDTSSPCFIKLRVFMAIAIAVTFSIIINGLMIIVFIYFFYVPIKYVLSNAPDQVLVVYHSAVLLVGAFIAYKAVFYKDES